MPLPIVAWFRRDLRLSDHPALVEAAKTGRPIIPLYILEDDEKNSWADGAASKWWLHQSLEALSKSLEQLGGRLYLRRGSPQKVLTDVIQSSGAKSLYWSRCYEPYAINRDKSIKSFFVEAHFDVKSFNSNLLFEPWEIQTADGSPYRVFTPYWKSCLKLWNDRRPLLSQYPMTFYEGNLSSDILESWALCPQKKWADGFKDMWCPGETGAQDRLNDFISNRLKSYVHDRDKPGLDGTSRLSPHLHWGEISPIAVITAIESAMASDSTLKEGGEKFLSELGWREFSHHLLYYFPTLPEQNFQSKFDHFEWQSDEKDFLEKWQRGKTGYPIVDAGMRELWKTGWMHNRVRMIVASFLTKHLRIHWRRGEEWFWDTLVDADLAHNAASWQWVAGSGADAAPYFRIFNPILQGERFDPDGDYVRQWVPELAELPSAYIHKPWCAPATILNNCHIVLGQNYPMPIVDHQVARKYSLDKFKKL